MPTHNFRVGDRVTINVDSPCGASLARGELVTVISHYGNDSLVVQTAQRGRSWNILASQADFHSGERPFFPGSATEAAHDDNLYGVDVGATWMDESAAEITAMESTSLIPGQVYYTPVRNPMGWSHIESTTHEVSTVTQQESDMTNINFSNRNFSIGDRIIILVDRANGAAVKRGQTGIIEKFTNDAEYPQPTYRIKIDDGGSIQWIISDEHMTKFVEGVELPVWQDPFGIYKTPLTEMTDEEKAFIDFRWNVLRAYYRDIRLFKGTEHKEWSLLIDHRRKNNMHTRTHDRFPLGFIPALMRHPVNPGMPYSEVKKTLTDIVYNAPNNNDEISVFVKKYARFLAYEMGQRSSWEGYINSARDRVKLYLEEETGIEYRYCNYHSSELVHPEIAMNLQNAWYCPEAFEIISRECEECGETVSVHNLRIHEGQGLCPNCHHAHTHILMNHSEDVTEHLESFRVMPNEKNQKLFFGLELEVLPRRRITPKDAVNAAKEDLKGFACMKSDGSLDAGGFEIVTAPASLAFHREKLWNAFFKDGGAHTKVKSWNTTCCGLHIHFSRAALTPGQLGKFFVFMHEENNNAFLTKIAGRDVGEGAEWCGTKKKKLSRALLDDEFIPHHAQREGRESEYHTHDHYEACNISSTTGFKTCEVRIFRGNASRHGVMRALDFVAALIQYAGESSCSALTSREFLAWFNQEKVRANYPDLWRQLLSLRLLKTEHRFRVIQGGRLVRNPIRNEQKDALGDDVDHYNLPDDEDEETEESRS